MAKKKKINKEVFDKEAEIIPDHRSYGDKLKDPRWQRKRLEIMNRDEFTCRLCGSTDKTLHIHHKKYHGNPWCAENSDLETLCEDCHSVVESLKKQGFKRYPSRIIKRSDWQESFFVLLINDRREKMIIIMDSMGVNMEFLMESEADMINKLLDENPF